MTAPPIRLIRLVPDTATPPIEVDEALLVSAAALGEETAQGLLFRRYAPKILPLLVRLLSSTTDAEDALQDTFLVAFLDLPKLKDPKAFGSWLRQIAVHQAQRRFRRRRLLRVLGLDRPPPDATLERLADWSVSAEARAELGRLDTILSRASTKERIAWILRHVEGYPLEEVAALSGASLASVKRWIAAVQARIQAATQEAEGDR